MARSRIALAVVLAALCAPPVRAESWGPRDDVGVAAVDTRTGKVLWEVWRLDEVPAGASKEEKAAAEYLLRELRDTGGPLPRVALLPEFPLNELEIKDPLPRRGFSDSPIARAGKGIIYYTTNAGVIALDRKTKKEAWRLLTHFGPFPSGILEVGENLTLVQLGSDTPAALREPLVEPRHPMLHALKPNTLKQRATAAVLLHAYGDGYLRPEVQKLVEQLRAVRDDPTAATHAKGIEKLLASWPQKRDRQRLLDGCVAALLGSEGDPFNGFALPAPHRVLVWCLVQEAVYGRPVNGYVPQEYGMVYHAGWTERPVSLPDATKAKLAEHCRKVLADGPDAEKPFAAGVLVSTAIGWAGLTDAERKELLLSPNPSAWRWAALALAKHGRHKELIEWARARPPEDHLAVLPALDGPEFKKPKKWAEGELEFWVAVARRNASGVAAALGGPERPPTEFREPIRAYLTREIAKPTVTDTNERPGHELSAALRVLSSWNNADDTPLLLEYLQHPASSANLIRTEFRDGNTVHVRVRVYHIRSTAAGALQARGAKVPPGVMYEGVLGPDKE